MGKMYSFLAATSCSDLEKIRLHLDGVSKNNLQILKSLLDRSENTSQAFIHHVASNKDIYKQKILF